MLLLLATSLYHSAGFAVLEQHTLGRPPPIWEPLPHCKSCPTTEELRAPGLGLSLEIGYGTAVIRHHNGSYEHLAKLPGDAAYTSLMQSLASGPQQRIPDHIEECKTNWERLYYIKRRTQRLINKSLGWPASKEIGIMAKMVSNLIRETKLVESNPAAIVTSPDRVRLSYEELGDLFEASGVQDRFDNSRRLFHLSAAYAGFGFGVCKSYLDTYTCHEEESDLPEQNILHLDLQERSLSASMRTDQIATGRGLTTWSFVDSELGRASNHEAVSWTALQARVRSFVQSYTEPITFLLLSGESACDPAFKAAIRDALHGVVADGSLGALDWQCADFDFAAARGAAELAKRLQEGPVYCKDTPECKAKRKAIHESIHGELLVQA